MRSRGIGDAGADGEHELAGTRLYHKPSSVGAFADLGPQPAFNELQNSLDSLAPAVIRHELGH